MRLGEKVGNITCVKLFHMNNQPPPPDTRFIKFDKCSNKKFPLAGSIEELTLISPKDRLIAGFLDILTVIIPFGLPIQLFSFSDMQSQSWGKKRCKHIVIDNQTLEPLSFFQYLYRRCMIGFVANVIGIYFLGVGIFWMYRDEENRTWGDLVSQTRVVKAPNYWN